MTRLIFNVEKALTVIEIPFVDDNWKLGDGPTAVASGVVSVDGVDNFMVNEEADPFELGKW